MSKLNNIILNSHTIFFAVYITQLTAIIAQGSLRSDTLELIIQIAVWGVMLGFSLAFASSYINKNDSEKNKLPEQLTNIFAMIGMAAFLFQLFTANITSAILLLLSWLLIALSFSFKKQRDLYFSLLASTTLLLYAASISKSSGFIIFIIIYTLAAVIALAGNFYLVKTKQQISASTKLNTVNNGFPFKLPISILAAIILLITTSLYLFVPRPAALNWGVFPAGGGNYHADDSWPKKSKSEKGSDISNDMSKRLDEAMEKLKDSGINEAMLEQLKDSGLKEKLEDLKERTDQIEQTAANDFDTSAFEYNGFNDELSINESTSEGTKSNYNSLIFYMEGKEPQYLRGNIYDYFDGLSWKKTQNVRTRIDRKDNKFTINRGLKKPYDLYTITMAYNLAGDPSIFIPPSTAELQFPSNAIASDEYGSLTASKQLRKGTIYSIKVSPLENKKNGRPVDKTREPSFEAMDRYMQLPKNISKRFIRFSKDISNGSRSIEEKATKIEKYLRENYEYSLESVFNSQGKIPLEEFLFKKPLGHCEYFATAMVMLMRAQDIPARLVTGFSVTNYNPVSGYYEARGMDAHAWAEVWIPNSGWVTFEATPAYALPKHSEAKNTSQSIEEYLQSRSQSAELTDPESLETSLINTAKYTFEQLNILLKRTWIVIKETVSWAGTMLLYYGWLVLLLLTALFIAYHYLKYYWVHRKVRKSLSNLKGKPAIERLQVSYRQMEHIFTLYKQPRKKEWTVQQYQAHLRQEFPEMREQLEIITKTLNDCLYQDRRSTNKAVTSDEVETAIRHIQKIINTKFKKPIPAEKQINAIKTLFNSFQIREA